VNFALPHMMIISLLALLVVHASAALHAPSTARPVLQQQPRRRAPVFASEARPSTTTASAADEATTPEALRLGGIRAAGVSAASAGILALALPNAPDYWRVVEDTDWLPAAPLLTLGGMFALVVAGWSAFGTEMHPITAKARGLEPPKGYAFQILGLSAVLLSAASVGLSWYPLPFAAAAPGGSVPLELAHCLFPVALWQVTYMHTYIYTCLPT